MSSDTSFDAESDGVTNSSQKSRRGEMRSEEENKASY